MSVAPVPLDGIVVVNSGHGMPMALISKFLREMGARVIRIESENDPFGNIYPAYRIWQTGQERCPAASLSPEALRELIASADVCLLGGEDFPGLERTGGARALVAAHDRLVALEITGYPDGMPQGPAVDILVQARAGLTHEQYGNRAVLASFSPSLYGAAMLGLSGILAGLIEREARGRGQAVFTSLYEGAVFWASSFWFAVEKPSAASDFILPKDCRALLFECADGAYVQFSFGTAGAPARLYKVLGIDDAGIDPNSSGMPSAGSDPKNFFGDIDLIGRYVKSWKSEDLIEALKKVGLPAELVHRPGDCWDDEQVKANRIIAALPDGTRYIGNPIQVEQLITARPTQLVAGDKPLDGLRIVDFGAYVAGPLASVLLGDLGADVIKVETVAGDLLRNVFRNFGPCNRGKRAIAIEMKRAEGQEIARRLCKRADMVTNNFRPGAAARLGIDAASLLNIRPDLVVLESPGYGSNGPRSGDAAFDMIMQAFCGFEYRAGGVGNMPIMSRISLADYAGGIVGTVALLLGYYHRARTGGCAVLTVPLLNASMYLLSDLIHEDGQFKGAPYLNRQMTGFHPAEALYQVRDGWIAIAARDGESAQRLVKALGIESAITKGLSDWGDAEYILLSDVLGGFTLSELLSCLSDHAVWAAACVDAVKDGMLDNPDLIQHGLVHQSEYPVFGAVRQIGSLLNFSRSDCGSKECPPLKGQHTREILDELGYDATQIERFFAERIVA